MAPTVSTTEDKAHDAAQVIIAAACRPPQIDYVSPAQRAKQRQAQDFINGLPVADRNYWSGYITDQIDAYHESGAAVADAQF